MNLLTKHLDTWTTAPNGIKKLRELILELAVRGLLVPQNPDDEPASVLLEKIADEKARLISEGKIKKSAPLPKIADDEKPFKLPTSWEWAKLGELGQIVGGGTPESDNLEYFNENEIPWLTPADLNNFSRKFIERGRRDISQLGLKNSSAQLMPTGTVLFSSRAPIGYVAIASNPISTNQGFKSCCPHIVEINQYLYYFLKASVKKIEENATGTTFKEISGKTFSLITVPLPPLAEQHRIVAKVDELMQLCDQLEQKQTSNQDIHAQLVSTLLTTLTQATDPQAFQAAWTRIAANFDSLFTTESSIEQLKQTILQLAVMGKLVEQEAGDEPASVLLEKIAQEKARLISEGKIKKNKIYPKINENELFQLPKIWTWARLNELVQEMDAGWSPACIPSASPSSDIWGVLRTTSVQVMKYLEYENKELPQKLEPKLQYEVKEGDILITRAGPENRVAIACLVDKTRPKLMISDKIIRFSLFDVGISGRFIALCLNTGATSEYLKKAKSGMAASQMNISQDNLNLAPVPLPPIAQQHRIVAKVDELMALCDQLKTKLNTAQTLQTQLTEALVQQVV